jgi:hypothetical protein
MTTLKGLIWLGLLLNLALYGQVTGQTPLGTDGPSGPRFFPVLDPAFDAEPTFFVKSGIMNVSGSSASGTAVGAELAFNCLFFEPAVGKIRPAFSLNRYSDEVFTLSTIELNPSYVYYITQNLSVGVGPGLGYMISSKGPATNTWTVQAGVGIGYDLGIVSLGLEARYQWQENEDKGAVNLNNSRVNFKIGVNL